MHPDDVQNKAITTHFGLFEFPFMSFGLRNATQTFQRFMDEILRGFEFCFAYIDDIMVYYRTREKYERNLLTFFRQLQAHGILLNPSKCLPSHIGYIPRLQNLRQGFIAAAGPLG
jgi:hypothetical protein